MTKISDPPVPLNLFMWNGQTKGVPDGSAHDGFGPRRRMVRPTSLSLLNSATVDSAHSSSGHVSGGNLRIAVSAIYNIIYIYIIYIYNIYIYYIYTTTTRHIYI